jgi:hypothetical protein
METRELSLAGGVRFEFQPVWTPGHRGRNERCAWVLVGKVARALEFFLQRGGKQHAVGEFTKFHQSPEF